MSAYVRFWGTRGSIATPGAATRKVGGNTSCVEIRTDDALFICDGGTGLRELGMDLLKRAKADGATKGITGHLLFSHTHWDHIQGFPFFVPVYDPRNTFYVYGVKAGDRRTYELLSGQMRGDYFPVDFSELKSRIVADDLWDGTREIQGVKVSCMEQQHPGKSYAFAFEKEGWKIVYATDNELDLLLDPKPPEADLKRPRKLPQDLIDFVKGADLLIADAQYTDAEYPAKMGWGHPRATTVVDLAVAANVKQVALYHHDPMHTDVEVEQIVEECSERARRQDSPVQVFAAREGVELKIG